MAQRRKLTEEEKALRKKNREKKKILVFLEGFRRDVVEHGGTRTVKVHKGVWKCVEAHVQALNEYYNIDITPKELAGIWIDQIVREK